MCFPSPNHAVAQSRRVISSFFLFHDRSNGPSVHATYATECFPMHRSKSFRRYNVKKEAPEPRGINAANQVVRMRRKVAAELYSWRQMSRSSRRIWWCLLQRVVLGSDEVEVISEIQKNEVDLSNVGRVVVVVVDTYLCARVRMTRSSDETREFLKIPHRRDIFEIL